MRYGKKKKVKKSKMYRAFEDFVTMEASYNRYSDERYRFVPAHWMKEVDTELFRNGPRPSAIPMSWFYNSDGALRINLSRCLVKNAKKSHFEEDGDFVIVEKKFWKKLVAEYDIDDGKVIARHYPFIYYPTDISCSILKVLKSEVKKLQKKIGRFFKRRGLEGWDVDNKQVRAFMYRYLLGGTTMKRAFKSNPTKKMIDAWCRSHKQSAIKAAAASKDKKVLDRVLEHHSRSRFFDKGIHEGDYKLVKALWTPANHDYAMAVVKDSGYEYKKVRDFILQQEQLISATSSSDD